MITVETNGGCVHIDREDQRVKMTFRQNTGAGQIEMEMTPAIAVKIAEAMLQICCPPANFIPKPYEIVKDGKLVFEGKPV